jgi:modulator of FtsH protease HflK
MTMTRSLPAQPGFGARLTELAAATRSLLAAGVASARWRMAGRQAPVLNSGGGRGDGPPDLEEVWRNFNRKLGGLFGGKGDGQPPQGPGPGGGNFQPDMKSAGVGVGLIAGVVVVVWAASGFFIVQEGQQSVVTSFGKYSKTVQAGFNWRFPYPFQAHETVSVTQLRSAEVGRDVVVSETGLRDSLMLTKDVNVVDIRFTVQYRIKSARDFLFENARPEDAVPQAAESAVREIVGRNTLDDVLFKQRESLASDLRKSVQSQLNLLKTGIEVVNVNIVHVQPPEQVRAEFVDASRAKDDKARFRTEGETFAKDRIAKAQIPADQLREQAKGYAERVVLEARGDAQRFASVLTEYQKAPTVTRDRLYIDTMRQVYGNVSKVLVDGRGNSNMLYLPLDKLIQQANPGAAPSGTSSMPAPAAASNQPSTTPAPAQPSSDSRTREVSRSRDRDAR